MSGIQEYSNTHPAWSHFGETSGPPPVPTHHSASLRSSPRPWHGTVQGYIPFGSGTINNLAGSVDAQPLPYRNGHDGHDVHGQPYSGGMFSGILKRILGDRIAHADSEIVGFLKEPCGPGRSRVTVTFETSSDDV